MCTDTIPIRPLFPKIRRKTTHQSRKSEYYHWQLYECRTTQLDVSDEDVVTDCVAGVVGRELKSVVLTGTYRPRNDWKSYLLIIFHIFHCKSRDHVRFI